MTQAYNLSQLANNLNTAGQVDATDGLVNAVPLVNGGTGATTAAAANKSWRGGCGLCSPCWWNYHVESALLRIYPTGWFLCNGEKWHSKLVE